MQAVVCDDYGPPEVLHVAEVAEPASGPGEINIAVQAAAINPADVKWRGGLLRQYSELVFPQVLGYDVAGIVSAVGGDVAGFEFETEVTCVLDVGESTYAAGEVGGAVADAQVDVAGDGVAQVNVGDPGPEQVDERGRVATRRDDVAEVHDDADVRREPPGQIGSPGDVAAQAMQVQ